MPELTYEILTVVDRVYVSAANRPIQGYEIAFFIPELGEELRVQVPNLDKETVKKSIDKLVSQRAALIS